MLRTLHYKSLREYLDALPRGGHKRLSQALGITVVYLSQLASRQDGREPSPSLCNRIEQLTHGAVPRQLLREDWREIWPDLQPIESAKPAAAAA